MVGEEDPLFPSVLGRLSIIFEDNLRRFELRPTLRIDNKAAAIHNGRLRVSFIDQRMKSLQPEDILYREYFLKKCAMMQLMDFLGDANPHSNESAAEALEMLSADIDETLHDPSFASVSEFVRGRNLVTSHGSTLFAASYLWKVFRAEGDQW